MGDELRALKPSNPPQYSFVYETLCGSLFLCYRTLYIIGTASMSKLMISGVAGVLRCLMQWMRCWVREIEKRSLRHFIQWDHHVPIQAWKGTDWYQSGAKPIFCHTGSVEGSPGKLREIWRIKCVITADSDLWSCLSGHGGFDRGSSRHSTAPAMGVVWLQRHVELLRWWLHLVYANAERIG